jgi:hypothetical protein
MNCQRAISFCLLKAAWFAVVPPPPLFFFCYCVAGFTWNVVDWYSLVWSTSICSCVDVEVGWCWIYKYNELSWWIYKHEYWVCTCRNTSFARGYIFLFCCSVIISDFHFRIFNIMFCWQETWLINSNTCAFQMLGIALLNCMDSIKITLSWLLLNGFCRLRHDKINTSLQEM